MTAPSRRAFTETIDLTEHDLEVEVHVQASAAGAADPIPMKVISPAPAEPAEQPTAAETGAAEAPGSEA